MTPTNDVRRTRHHRLTALVAAVWLAFGWTHVWLHYAAAQDDGHFSSQVASDCPLAQLPWQILPEAPSCTAPTAVEAQPAAEPRIVFARDAVRRPGVRAPPLS